MRRAERAESTYDVVVVGGGHAGIEAASAAARIGCRTALITLALDTIGRLSCNPAVGGMGKGQLACEIDGLGGEMARLADLSGIQFKTLGKRKGPAMWSPRSQNDKDLYPQYARERLEEIDRLDLIEASVDDVRLERGVVTGVIINGGTVVPCRALVLCAGTFLCGKIHIGEYSASGGRIDEKASHHLTGSLAEVGFETARLKTGTPPRIARDSIDFSSCETDSGDRDPRPFSFATESVANRIDCYTTATTVETHQIIAAGTDRSPMFSGRITGAGPRYCPSVEDKVWRFADRDSHHIFLEPEGLGTESIYVNGFSTSLPRDVQEAALRSIPGLERAQILKYGYAVEYDYFPPHQLTRGLMSRMVAGLFFAGQVNGTSGYEEAAAQGLVAGINAALWVAGEEELAVDRADGYLGVLLDDLSTLSTTEPYRLFTSRAEYRLTLRRDNADLRMEKFAARTGLLSVRRRREIAELRYEIERHRVLLRDLRTVLRRDGEGSEEGSRGEGVSGRGSSGSETAWQLLRRPEVSLDDLVIPVDVLADYPLLRSSVDAGHFNHPGVRLREQLEIETRYEGYIARSHQEIEEFRRSESRLIPDTIDYQQISSISAEGREKLSRFRPRSLGHASRISGVSRSDLAVLMLYIR